MLSTIIIIQPSTVSDESHFSTVIVESQLSTVPDESLLSTVTDESRLVVQNGWAWSSWCRGDW